MDADALLRQIAPLPYPDRQRRLAEVARRERTDSGWRTLLLDLATRGRYERRCALLLASVARDHEHVQSMLTVGAADERAQTLCVAVRLGIGADDFVRILPELSGAGRRALVRAVRKYGTTALADVLLPRAVAEFGEPLAAGLLPACSSTVVASSLADLGWAVTSWSALGHRHPVAVLDHVETTLADTPRALWAAELFRLGSAVGAAAAHEPDRVLDLIERCAPDVALPVQVRQVFGALARHDPARSAQALLSPGAASLVCGRAVIEALLPLPDNILGRLAAAESTHRLARFLRHVPPARRVAVYRAAVGESAADVPSDVLDVLPWAERHSIAARLLGRHDVADDPDRRLAVVARLAFEQAEAPLTALTRSPTAARRAVGYRLLLTAARGSRDPDVVTAVLTGLTRLANEQDPVRLWAVEGVADLPGRLLTTTSAGLVLKIIEGAVTAPDCSWATRSAASRAATGLLRDGLLDDRPDLVEAGFTAVAALGRGQHVGHLSGLFAVLPRAADVRVFEALAPQCAAEARVGDFDTVLALAAELGPDRTARLPELSELLGAATRAKNDGVVRRAIGMWLAPSATRDERVGRLLAADRSTVTIHEVARAIAARRTDLLDDVLRRPSHGRFLARGVRFLPAVGEWSKRWNPAQVEAFRTSAAGLAEDTAATTQQRVAAIRELRLLPGSDPVLRRLAAAADIVVAEAALASLGMSDDPRAVVADLLAVVATDRARVAVPALRRCLDRMTPAQVVGPLAALLAAPKVTVRKDAVRLVVDLAVPDATGMLQRLWQTAEEHRDVRRAVPPSLRQRLDDDRAWAVLSEAVADPSTASALVDVSQDGVPPRHRARWAHLLLVAVGTIDDDAVARAALGNLGRWVRYAPAEITATLTEIVVDLDRTGRWRAAVPELVQAAGILADAAPLGQVARLLLERAGTIADTDAGQDRDRPVRQRVATLTRRVCDGASGDPALRARLGPLVEILRADNATRDLAVDVAAAAVSWDHDPGADLDRLVAVANTTTLAARGADGVAQGLRATIGTVQPDSVANALAALSDTASVGAALVRLAIVDVAGWHSGWAPRWRETLRELRSHPDPDVTRSAQRVTTATE